MGDGQALSVLNTRTKKSVAWRIASRGGSIDHPKYVYNDTLRREIARLTLQPQNDDLGTPTC